MLYVAKRYVPVVCVCVAAALGDWGGVLVWLIVHLVSVCDGARAAFVWVSCGECEQDGFLLGCGY